MDAKVLEFMLIKQGGTFSFYGVGSKYKELIASDTQKQATEKFNQNINLLKDPSTKDINSVSEKVIEFLNLVAKTKYKESTKTTRGLISSRLKDGFNLEDFKIVIKNKADEWLGTEYEKFLRPSTLFRESKFEEYLNQKNDKKKIEINENEKSKIYNDFEFDD